MTVMVINEDNHGMLAITKDYKSAIDWLVENDWLTQSSETYDEDAGEFHWMIDWLGEDWLEKIYKMTLDQFFELNSDFHIHEEPVFGAD